MICTRTRRATRSWRRSQTSRSNKRSNPEPVFQRSNVSMYRRDFIKKSAAAVAVAGFPRYAEQVIGGKPERVALIGSGWYGKSDLLRMVQVAPVEVVSLCDVDKNMVAEAAELVATRQQSKKKPRTYGDYRGVLKGEDLHL